MPTRRGKSIRLIAVERIARTIVRLRGQNVIIDSDLADLYGVTTSRLNEQVKRNARRFPVDFLFQMNQAEFVRLRSQIAISNAPRRGGRRSLPFAFTEHGVIMAATVLNTARAIEVSVRVVRAFVALRQLLESNAILARKLASLERRYDGQFAVVFRAIKELMPAAAASKRRIGFS